MAFQKRDEKGRFATSEKRKILDFVRDHFKVGKIQKSDEDTPELDRLAKLAKDHPDTWEGLKKDIHGSQYKAIIVGGDGKQRAKVPSGIQHSIEFNKDAGLWSLTIVYPKNACIDLPAGVFRFIQIYASAEDEAKHILAIFEALGIA